MLASEVKEEFLTWLIRLASRRFTEVAPATRFLRQTSLDLN